MSAREEFITGLAAEVGELEARRLLEPSPDRRRIYVDGQGDGWIDLTVDPETGERELTGITNPWKIATADEVRSDTGGLSEIGRCW